MGMKIYKQFAIAAAFMALMAFAQDAKKADPPTPSQPAVEIAPTSDEEIDIRVAQIAQYQAQQNLDRAIANLPETQAAQDAKKRLAEEVNKFIAAHKIDMTKSVLCDGPSAQEPLCKDVKPGRIVAKVRPAPPTKK